MTVDNPDPKTDARRRLEQATSRHADGGIPEPIRAITEAHQERLTDLIQTLRRAGVDEELVRHSIREVVSSYEQELVEALATLREANQ